MKASRKKPPRKKPPRADDGEARVEASRPAVPWWETLAVVLLAGFGSLWRFEERTVLYFDEVINSAKAGDGLIFDYSLRPVFYGLNRLAWVVVGEDFGSLRLVALVCYVATAYLVFRAGWGLAGRECAWAAFLAFAYSHLVLLQGIRGMPHLPGGFWLTLSLLLWVLSEEKALSPPTRWWCGFGAGVAAVVAVGCHPTVLPFLGPLGLWSLAAIFRDASRPLRFKAVAGTGPFGLLLGLGASFVLFVAVLMGAGQGFYFSSLTRGIGVVQTEERYSFYYEPWYFYFREIGEDPTLLVLLGLAVLVGVAFLAFAGVGRRAPLREHGARWRTAFLVGASLLCLAVISALSWKFERVLVAYVPLLSLTGAYVVASAAAVIRSPVARRSALGVFFLTLLAAGGLSVGRVDESMRTAPRTRAHFLYEFTELLDSLVTDGRVAYLGDHSAFKVVRRCALAANLQMPYVEDPVGEDTARRRSVETRLVEKGIQFLVLNFGDGDGTGEPADPRWWEEGFAFTAMEEVYQYRNQFKLVRITPRTGDNELVRSLDAIPVGTQLAVLGQPQELDTARATWLDQLLKRHGLRDYRLWLAKSPRVMFSYVQPKGLRYILLTGVEPTHEEHLEEFRQFVVAAGGIQLAVDPVTATELWELEP